MEISSFVITFRCVNFFGINNTKDRYVEKVIFKKNKIQPTCVVRPKMLYFWFTKGYNEPVSV